MPVIVSIALGSVTTVETVALLAAVGGLLALWMWLRRRRRRVAVPVVDWEARAEAAERRAAEAETVVKAGLIPYLARLLRAKLVTGLLHQRRELLERHEKGAQRAEVLEARLASAQEGLKEKIRHYETQVKALEEQVGARRPPSSPSGTERPQVPPAAGVAASKKNPFIHRPIRPAPTSLKFGDLVARKEREGLKPGKESEGAGGKTASG